MVLNTRYQRSTVNCHLQGLQILISPPLCNSTKDNASLFIFQAMLKPIKSLLTYWQRNVNDSTIRGTTSTGMSETNNETGEVSPILLEIAEDDKITENVGVAILSPLKTPHDQNENEVIPVDRNVDVASAKGDDIKTDDVLIVDDDGFIKLIDLTVATNDALSEEESKNDLVESNVELLQQQHEVDGVDSCEESYENTASNDNKSDIVDLCVESNGNVSNDELHQEDKADVIDLCVESNEMIILEETNNSDSIADPVSDPLAIDDYNADISSNNNISTMPNSGLSDLDTSTEEETLYTIHVTEAMVAEHGTIKQDDTSDDHFAATNLQLEEINNEEQEVRSDGSDSGLGSETSTIQSTNTSVVMDSPICKGPPGRSNLKRRSNDVEHSSLLGTKRSKRSINFNGVNVYYFSRIQGFACVPSQGGCTLGMAAHHVHSKTFTLAEHAAEQRRVHKQQMQEINPRASSSDETDSEEEISEASGSDLEADANGFLQPVPARQRRALLKAAGIRKIDPTEKDECRIIRSSREFCGCSCRGYCDPDTCSCSQSGIKCQVDRPSFPCGCTRDGCANVVGRVEFNPSRVRTHYIHTIMRLDLENKQKRADELDSSANSSSMLNYASNSVPSTMNNCTSGTNGLNNLCNFNNLVNTNHIRQQPMYDVDGVCGTVDEHLQHNQSTYANGANSIYSSRLPNALITPLPSQLQVDVPVQQQQRLLDNSSTTNSSHTINDSCISLQSTTNHSHDIDLHYAFRDNPSSIGVSTNNSTNMLGLGDYQPTSNPLYHEVYNGHSFLNQNYSNSAFCSTPGSSYVGYQQNFISYASSSSTPIDITDLASPTPIVDTNGAGCTDTNSYISLHSPIGNSSRVDVITDLLHTGRATVQANLSVTPPISTNTDPSITLLSCGLAPSAQTSTSITEGTQTTITQPQATKPEGFHLNIVEPKFNEFVDLTVQISPAIKHEDENSLNDIIEVVHKEDIKIDIDSTVELSTPTTSTITRKQCTTKISNSVPPDLADPIDTPTAVDAVDENALDIVTVLA